MSNTDAASIRDESTMLGDGQFQRFVAELKKTYGAEYVDAHDCDGVIHVYIRAGQNQFGKRPAVADIIFSSRRGLHPVCLLISTPLFMALRLAYPNFEVDSSAKIVEIKDGNAES